MDAKADLSSLGKNVIWLSQIMCCHLQQIMYYSFHLKINNLGTNEMNNIVSDSCNLLSLAKIKDDIK